MRCFYGMLKNSNGQSLNPIMAYLWLLCLASLPNRDHACPTPTDPSLPKAVRIKLTTNLPKGQGEVGAVLL